MPGPSLLQQLVSVEQLSAGSKWRRMRTAPFHYLSSILYRELIYPIRKKEWIVEATLFYDRPMMVALPASIDIYLTGGKSHISEIRLAKLLINNLRTDSVFIDVGAHYGYFSMIASEILKDGKVYAFEPSVKSFAILQRNLSQLRNAEIFNKAVAGGKSSVVFYEFDNLHSEYNSTQVEQFENEEWFRSGSHKKEEVAAVSLSDFCIEKGIEPHIIKIDVEGFEDVVIQGAEQLLTNASVKPMVVIEYLEPKRGNAPHQAAVKLFKQWGYQAHQITNQGELLELDDIDRYLLEQSLDSDNIVFIFKR